MKYNLLLVAALFFVGCSAKVSSNPQDVLPFGPVEPPPPLGSQSPFSEEATLVKGAQKSKLVYVEAMQTTTADKIELRFFTAAPRGLCNSSTFTDSSWYQPKMQYVRMIIDTAEGEKKIQMAEYGTRGDDYPIANKNVSGTVNFMSSRDGQYTGWIDAKSNEIDVRGNFDVVNCMNTETLHKKIDLKDMRTQMHLISKQTGQQVPVYFEISLRPGSSYSYNGYVNPGSSTQISINTLDSASVKFSLDTGGINAGAFLGAGNTTCESSSGGPVVGVFKDSSLTFNDLIQAYACSTAALRASPKVRLEYNAMTLRHTLTVFWNNQEYTADY